MGRLTTTVSISKVKKRMLFREKVMDRIGARIGRVKLISSRAGWIRC